MKHIILSQDRNQVFLDLMNDYIYKCGFNMTSYLKRGCLKPCDLEWEEFEEFMQISFYENLETLNYMIIDYIAKFDFEISNYLEEKEKWHNLNYYMHKTFNENFVKFLKVVHPFFYEFMKLAEIYVFFNDAVILYGTLYFTLTTHSFHSLLDEVYPKIDDRFGMVISWY